MYKYRYFKLDEFTCPDCGANKINPDFVHILDAVRRDCGFPLHVNSGYRCKKHNHDIGGVPDSAHLAGLAADLAVHNGDERLRLVMAALKHGIRRIGVARSFIHLDIDASKAPAIWTY